MSSVEHLGPGDEFEGFAILSSARVGTTAVVYEVRDGGGNRHALKIFTGSLRSDAHERFIREATILQGIVHANVVKAGGLSRVGYDARPYFPMEYVDGVTLSEWYKRAVDDSTITPARIIRIVRQLADALHAIIKRNRVVHRDLKLENILVTGDDECKLIDFGLSRCLDAGDKLPSSWARNAAPRYRAPEKWRDFHAADEKSDVWSVGVIAYYLLTGVFPFDTDHKQGSEHQLEELIRDADPVPPSYRNRVVPPSCDLLTMQMLARNAAFRPTFGEVIDLIDAGEQGLPRRIVELQAARADRLTSAEFDVESDPRRLLELDGVALLHSRSFRMGVIDVITRATASAVRTLLAAPCRWGPSFHSTAPRVANVCEVLLCIDDAALVSDEDVARVGSAARWLLGAERPDGYPSLSYDLVTTQCTALAALALDHVSKLIRLPGDLREEACSAGRRGARLLAQLADARGWGTWGKGRVRIQPTIWALRGMTVDYSTWRDAIHERMEQLRAMHSAGEPGCFGFQPGSERRVSPTASFLILASSIDRQGYRPNEPHYTFEKYNATKYLCYRIRSTDEYVVESEQEIFLVDPWVSSSMANIEQLSWNHVSGPLAIQALGAMNCGASVTEDSLIVLIGALQLARGLLRRGTLTDMRVASSGLAEAMYPTCYGVVALGAVREWLAGLERGVVLPEPPPPPAVVGGVIYKSGAVIIVDGRLLLVRKYGTDQLILPGGGIETGEDPRAALKRELGEELNIVDADISDAPLGVYRAPAAFEKGVDVEITLYAVRARDVPIPSAEIEECVWFEPGQLRPRPSAIVEHHILPDLLKRGLL